DALRLWINRVQVGAGLKPAPIEMSTIVNISRAVSAEPGGFETRPYSSPPLHQPHLGEQRLVADLEHDRILLGHERMGVPARHGDDVADRQAHVRVALDLDARLAADHGVEMIDGGLRA